MEWLQRYGVRWRGRTEPICEPMPDGYWTPWHVANEAYASAIARAEAAERDNARLREAADRYRLLRCHVAPAELVERLRRARFSVPNFGDISANEDIACRVDRILDAVLAQPGSEDAGSFQSRVRRWMLACFGEAISLDGAERNHRFLEESLELVQSTGCTRSEAHQLVEYVFGRGIGDPPQEVGGVMVTLAALCHAHGMDMRAAGEAELARIWTKVEQIRAKQANKPRLSPLPGSEEVGGD